MTCLLTGPQSPTSGNPTRRFNAGKPVNRMVIQKEIMKKIKYYSKDILKLKPDVKGAKMWAVALEKTMLTYFEIESNSTFEMHCLGKSIKHY